MSVILLTTSYTGKPLEILCSVCLPGFAIDILERVDRDCLIAHAPGADYILASGRLAIDGEILDAAPRLKMIQRTGVGLDSIDLLAVKERGVPIYVNEGVNSLSVAEHAVYLMLATLKNASLVSASMRDGLWNKQKLGTQSRTLSGKTVGLVGLGNIGRRVARFLRAFDVTLFYADTRRADAETEAACGATYVSTVELLKRSDVVSLHCPLNEATRGMIGPRELSLMKETAVLVNTARGALIGQEALIDALTNGTLAGAGLDTFEPEPLPPDSPLRKMPNVIATPHIAGVTQESFTDMMRDAMRNIALFEAGQFAEIEEHKLK